VTHYVDTLRLSILGEYGEHYLLSYRADTEGWWFACQAPVVLEAGVNFFLNSRKQGLPCWHSLFFSGGHFKADSVFLIKKVGKVRFQGCIRRTRAA